MCIYIYICIWAKEQSDEYICICMYIYIRIHIYRYTILNNISMITGKDLHYSNPLSFPAGSRGTHINVLIYIFIYLYIYTHPNRCQFLFNYFCFKNIDYLYHIHIQVFMNICILTIRKPWVLWITLIVQRTSRINQPSMNVWLKKSYSKNIVLPLKVWNLNCNLPGSYLHIHILDSFIIASLRFNAFFGSFSFSIIPIILFSLVLVLVLVLLNTDNFFYWSLIFNIFLPEKRMEYMWILMNTTLWRWKHIYENVSIYI
jgi:hypothetical protein